MLSLVLSGAALAVNRVEVKVTSEPIASGASCDKAGGFSLEFDTSTALLDGDQITIDTDFVNATNFTALCRDIDLVIAPGSGANITSQADGGNSTNAGWTNGSTPDELVDSPVVYSGTAPTDVEEGIIFHVVGNSGSQRITVDVVGIDTTTGADGRAVNAVAGSLIVGPGVNDKIIVRFLDQDVNFTTGGIFVDNNTTTDDTYDQPADLEDNTLCINVSSWSESTVKGNMDSRNDKYTFIPSNPQIAHVVSAAEYALYECAKANCGNLALGATSQAGSSCGAFDNEDPGAAGTAYMNSCATVDDHANNQFIIQKTNGTFDLVDYIVTATILVNGVEGDNGVYFTSDAILTDGASTSTAACAFTNASGSAIGAASYFQADGTTATPVAADTDCDIAGSARAVELTTLGHNLNLAANDDFLFINIPEMHYDLGEVEDGDQVSVRITLTKAPCGEVTTQTLCVGTFLEECPTSAGSETMIFPYFTSPAATDAWWDGVAITNESATAGTATVTLYEQDGDSATASIAVAARSMYVNTLTAMISGGVFTASSGNAGTIGDSRCFLSVSTDFAASGFAMIANTATGESMGYTSGN
ncbi:MAG: hypothetical protein HY885_06525 [Deltaproteobacteria bacterium]|nr:hypothetical protein [Deltaproteobacteria bacterium]